MHASAPLHAHGVVDRCQLSMLLKKQQVLGLVLLVNGIHQMQACPDTERCLLRSVVSLLLALITASLKQLDHICMHTST